MQDIPFMNGLQAFQYLKDDFNLFSKTGRSQG